MIFLKIYIVTSLVILILYQCTDYSKQLPKYWKGGSRLRLALYYILRPILFLIVWPGLVLQLISDKYSPIYTIRWKYQRWRYSRHTFLENEIGGGIIECQECSHQEKIIVSIHHQSDCDYRLGYQCQKCGNHIALADPFKYEIQPKCDCGGKLSNKKPVLCSQCGSKEVIYYRTYLT